VKGAAELLTAAERQFDVKAGQTSNDNKVSLLTARCVGNCGNAPVVVFDNEVEGKLTVDNMRMRTKGWRE
jgi:bidirectional [NiFe] hydrogenase diaphorase subunit